MGQSRDLCVKLQTRSALLFGQLQLTFLELSDVLNSNRSTEVSKDAALGFIDCATQSGNALSQSVMSSLSL